MESYLVIDDFYKFHTTFNVLCSYIHSFLFLQRVFSLESPHGPGGVFFTWQKASGGFLASTGYNQVVNVYDRHGNLREQIHLPG